MSLVDKIVDKTPEEAIRIINEAYAEKQALDLSILSNPDLKAALVGALLGSGAGGIGGAISAAKNRNKVTINDILKGALLGAVPGATAGYMSKSLFNIDPGSEIASGFGKLKEKAKELKKSLFDKKEPEETPPPKKFDTNEKMQEEAKKLDEEAGHTVSPPPTAPPTAPPTEPAQPQKPQRVFPPQRNTMGGSSRPSTSPSNPRASGGLRTIRPADESKGYGFSR